MPELATYEMPQSVKNVTFEASKEERDVYEATKKRQGERRKKLQAQTQKR